MAELVGQNLDHFRILAKLGEGGMGVVYRARDDRLGRDVAIKVLPPELAQDPERVRRFEKEARAVAALSHPNVMAIFHVGSHDGAPYLVTELLDGKTLRELLLGGPPPPSQAVELALQITAGLAAAHGKGIVHRDLKPANLFVTTGGLVKILDFGLAKVVAHSLDPGTLKDEATLAESSAGYMVAGTVGYMAPEQVRGAAVDHRADLFALGCVLYEMLSGTRAFTGESPADTMSAILSSEPPPLSGVARRSDPALESIVNRCLAKRPEERFSSAVEVRSALQAVVGSRSLATVVTEREEGPAPYPGLAAFTEADAGHFFGREAEVAEMWERIPGQTMLALVGPSGSGKSSFIRAGLVPHAPEGWRVLVCEPGDAPLRSMARRLARELSGDAEALERLLDFDDPDVAVEVMALWRRRHAAGLVVVDQFEELFTLCPGEVQGRFATLLGRMVAEAGVHVALSMRDDFFFQCAAYPALAPVFDKVTPLMPPMGEALRRAVASPAEQLGYGFDDGLVDDMLGEVSDERGALPLLAFTVARLWELRDREVRSLTREAYERIGGVAGALAQHAESVLGSIGEERLPVVHELLRNLVTAQGTRVSRQADELLSVFDDHQAAAQVLRQLVDGRLLTTYEVEGAGGEASRHVEIIHESLLAVWPRLVRWQAQDADSARLRDQLRQAARTWDEHDRSDDLLWTGSAYGEYGLWRERYPGRLSELEETFARAMANLATRRRRQRRTAMVAALVVATTVAAVTTVLWRRSVLSERRAEAQKLLALGQVKLRDYPTAALAYARASLGVSDTPEGRRFVLEALWRGGAARIVTPDVMDLGYVQGFSPDGRWLAGGTGGWVVLISREGTIKKVLEGLPGAWNSRRVAFDRDNTLLITCAPEDPLIRFWSLAEERVVRTWPVSEVGYPIGMLRHAVDHLVTTSHDGTVLRAWPLGGGEPDVLPEPPATEKYTIRASGHRYPGCSVDLVRRRFLCVRGTQVLVRDLEAGAPELVVGTHEERVRGAVAPITGDRIIACDANEAVHVWTTGWGQPRLERAFKPSARHIRLPGVSHDGRRLAVASREDRAVYLWDLEGPPEAQPAERRMRDVYLFPFRPAFHPDGSWLMASSGQELALWPLSSKGPYLLLPSQPANLSGSLIFTPASDQLVGGRKVWALTAEAGPGREIDGNPAAVSPDGRCVAVCRTGFVLLDCGAEEQRVVIDDGRAWWAAAFSQDGRRLAAATYEWRRSPEEQVLKIVDLESGRVRTIPVLERSVTTDQREGRADQLLFTPGGDLLSAGWGGVRRWNLDTGAWQWLYEAEAGKMSLTADGQLLLVAGFATNTLVVAADELRLLDLDAGTTRRIRFHGDQVTSLAINPTGNLIATGSMDAAVRVASVADDQEPHLLLGHDGLVHAVAFSPDGRWLASEASDGIRLWPMPDLSQPPLHTLPSGQLLARLSALTNLRAVRDPASDTGWKTEVGPFPGWQEAPTW